MSHDVTAESEEELHAAEHWLSAGVAIILVLNVVSLAIGQWLHTRHLYWLPDIDRATPHAASRWLSVAIVVCRPLRRVIKSSQVKSSTTLGITYTHPFHSKRTYLSDPLGAELAGERFTGACIGMPLAGCEVCTHNSQPFRSYDQKRAQ